LCEQLPDDPQVYKFIFMLDLLSNAVVVLRLAQFAIVGIRHASDSYGNSPHHASVLLARGRYNKIGTRLRCIAETSKRATD
jgi:hypothetical protein